MAKENRVKNVMSMNNLEIEMLGMEAYSYVMGSALTGISCLAASQGNVGASVALFVGAGALVVNGIYFRKSRMDSKLTRNNIMNSLMDDNDKNATTELRLVAPFDFGDFSYDLDGKEESKEKVKAKNGIRFNYKTISGRGYRQHAK